MKTPRFLRVTRAWLAQTRRNNQEIDFSISGPKLKLKFKLERPIETRKGVNPADKSPFYESDSKALFSYYHRYTTTQEYMDNVLYADILPFRTEGFNGIRLDAVSAEKVTVTIEPSSYRIPEKLKEHAKATVDLFKEMGKLQWFDDKQEWENNTSLRVDAVDENGNFSCRKARYFDQVATNITIDWASGKFRDKWRTIRSGMECPDDGALRSLEDSNLANTLGVAVMFYDQSLSPILRVRSDSMASIPKKGLHCTASGVHEVEPSQSSGIFDFNILKQGMLWEIKDEIGLDEHEYWLFPVVFARELPRGGKPQLFFMALSKVDDQRIKEGVLSAREAYEYVAEVTEEEYAKFSEIDPSSELFTYEGWACMRFAEKFVEANEDKLRRLVAAE